MTKLLRALWRKKVLGADRGDKGKLRRCLSVWDLTALGVGSTLGVGVYVLVGSVALHLAGPSVVLSFLIAAIAALVAGMCYAEFGSRIPKAGSAYIYTYTTIGEFAAFIVGWEMILEAVFGTASVARGLSMYVDTLSNHTMSEFFQSFAPMNTGYLLPHFDFFSFFLVLCLGVLLAVGVRESSAVHNVLTAVNVLIILLIIFAGAFKADQHNWSIPAELVPENHGKGGFFPYGMWGMLKGAAVCFYGFVGFDTISFAGEEARDPRRDIPISIVCATVVNFILYASAATVVSMMMPYYLQETVVSVASAFSYAGMEWARWAATVGAVVGISASLYGCMFPLPRLLYAMASDGLLFRWLSNVTERKAPSMATLLSAVVIAILSALLELNELILMMCIGTLLSYTIVAASVILLRYRSSLSSSKPGTLKLMFGVGQKWPTRNTAFVINIALLLFICMCLSIALIARYVEQPMVYMVVLHAIALLLLVIMALQPQVKEEFTFKTPLVPFVPCLSIYANINLMVLIKLQTWIRVLIWTAIGIPIYLLCVCCYKQSANKELVDGLNDAVEANVNGKPSVKIFVVSPTPPDTISRSNKGDECLKSNDQIHEIKLKEGVVISKIPVITEEIIVQHAYYEDNEEKEAKIIDLLDQVLQAEEDSYGEIISLREQEQEVQIKDTSVETKTHRKSLSELSDAGSDASMGNQVLSKYDVIAQVHREDLPRVNEEEEKSDKETELERDNDINDYEDTTAFNDSDSRTDESGYSDTIDKSALNESIDDLKKDEPIIPIPPPLDENFFTSPTFKKSYTISARPSKNMNTEEEQNKPRESVLSNTSVDDTPMGFGSDKQMSFMSKLNDIFQNKIASVNDDDQQRPRAYSTGNMIDNTELEMMPRPIMLFDLKKEITSREVAQNLRHVNVENSHTSSSEDEEDNSLSKEELKLKLENIFAAGGPQPLKKRVMKSNPPTPEEAYHTDTSSTGSLAKLPKMEKNDTLKRQKTKFGDVLNSFKMTLNKDDLV